MAVPDYIYLEVNEVLYLRCLAKMTYVKRDLYWLKPFLPNTEDTEIRQSSNSLKLYNCSALILERQFLSLF